MAKRTEVILIDDIDGSPAETTVKFGVDGQLYEIDLSGANNDELRRGLAKFILNGTRLGKVQAAKNRGPVPTGIRQPAGINRGRNIAIRNWCKQQGIEVNSLGRIPQAVIAKFDAAHAA
ncbi:histone-like nucleoid-structuring protein Lsr2 [Glycomyces buryatensis]|uniref:Lsr2 family protein n=1 Tax=Glycomyces buryatensis TaxID=2570927 RepID=A0A4S8PQW7_9ACTN|nr:Lsr2 family protein [Glycomyces buryatensis]THV33580.1 Lsr2 family protein [Glycomyces buryatensis]